MLLAVTNQTEQQPEGALGQVLRGLYMPTKEEVQPPRDEQRTRRGHEKQAWPESSQHTHALTFADCLKRHGNLGMSGVSRNPPYICWCSVLLPQEAPPPVMFTVKRKTFLFVSYYTGQ
ncbi:hypothetical protein WJX79_001167 [Trebouxia sp. C0005]